MEGETEEPTGYLSKCHPGFDTVREPRRNVTIREGRQEAEGYGGSELGSVHSTPTLAKRLSLTPSTQCWPPRRDTPMRVIEFSGHQGARRER